MSNTNRILLWGLGGILVLLLGGYLVWFWQNFERHYRDVLVDVSPAAQRNPFLAAERYLGAQGYPVESVTHRDMIAELPSGTDTLWLRQLPPQMDAAALAALQQWLESGGHLILMPGRASRSDDNNNLLAEMGVGLSRIRYPDIKNKDADLTAEADPEQRARMHTDTVVMTLPGDRAPVTALFPQGYALQDRDDWASFSAGDQYGSRVLLFRVGLGQVAVLSDLGLFSNDRIGLEDNAYLLSHLVQPGGKVWIQQRLEVPGLPLLLWQKFPLQLCIAASLLLVMGWRLFLYTGPGKALNYQQRRNLLEHIDASAVYAWRIDKGQRMQEENRDMVEQAWRRRHPVLNRMTSAQRSDWLAEHTGMASSAIARTLYGEIDKELDFIKATLVLQQLSSRLNKRELG